MRGSSSSSGGPRLGIVTIRVRDRMMLMAPTIRKGNMKPPISYSQAPTPGPVLKVLGVVITVV